MLTIYWVLTIKPGIMLDMSEAKANLINSCLREIYSLWVTYTRYKKTSEPEEMDVLPQKNR